MSDCLMSQRGGKYSRGKTITDENMSVVHKIGDIIWGPNTFKNCARIKASNHYFYCTRLNAMAVGRCAFMCIDPNNGDIIWQLDYNSFCELDVKSTLYGNLVLIGFRGSAHGASFVCYDINGNYKYGYSDSSGYARSVDGCCLDDNGNSYAALEGGYLVKVNLNGEVEWKISKSTYSSKIIIANNYLYCITEDINHIISISKYSLLGDINDSNYFSFSVSSDSFEFYISINSDMTNLYISASGKVYAIDITNSVGSLIYTLDANCYGIVCKNNFLYLSGNLEKYDAITGQNMCSLPYTFIPNNSYAIRDLAVNDEGYMLGIVDAGDDSKLFLTPSKDTYIINN